MSAVTDALAALIAIPIAANEIETRRALISAFVEGPATGEGSEVLLPDGITLIPSLQKIKEDAITEAGTVATAAAANSSAAAVATAANADAANAAVQEALTGIGNKGTFAFFINGGVTSANDDQDVIIENATLHNGVTTDYVVKFASSIGVATGSHHHLVIFTSDLTPEEAAEALHKAWSGISTPQSAGLNYYTYLASAPALAQGWVSTLEGTSVHIKAPYSDLDTVSLTINTLTAGLWQGGQLSGGTDVDILLAHLQDYPEEKKAILRGNLDLAKNQSVEFGVVDTTNLTTDTGKNTGDPRTVLGQGDAWDFHGKRGRGYHVDLSRPETSDLVTGSGGNAPIVTYTECQGRVDFDPRSPGGRIINYYGNHFVTASGGGRGSDFGGFKYVISFNLNRSLAAGLGESITIGQDISYANYVRDFVQGTKGLQIKIENIQGTGTVAKLTVGNGVDVPQVATSSPLMIDIYNVNHWEIRGEESAYVELWAWNEYADVWYKVTEILNPAHAVPTGSDGAVWVEGYSLDVDGFTGLYGGYGFSNLFIDWKRL